MDIYRYINSGAIRNHLKEIGYQFNTLEAAWLIYNCNRLNLYEKYIAWKELIQTLPDMAVDCREWALSHDSIHRSLTEYMKTENQIINTVMTSQGRFILELCEENGDKISFSEWCYDKYTASTFEDLMKKRNALFEENHYGIVKTTVLCSSDAIEGTYKLVFDINNQILVAEAFGTKKSDILFSSFDTLWFAFPTPFKEYDIVWDPKCPDNSDLWSGPFLLTETAYDIYQHTGKKMHDSSDMTAYGYFQDEYGNLYGECMHDYTSLEYYPVEKLQGYQRILIELREHLKGKTDIVHFVRTYHDLLNGRCCCGC